MHTTSLKAVFTVVLGLFTTGFAEGAEFTVNVYATFFSPTPLNINVGDRVTWINRDNDTHVIQSDTGAWTPWYLWDEDDSFSMTFNSAGTYPYRCGIYQFTGTIVVSGGGGGNIPPSVLITNPPAGTVFHAPASFTIQATASDSDGSVASVQFLVGGSSVGTDTTAPYTAAVNNLTAGTYSLSAIATDNLGAKATNTVSLIVNSRPTVSITNPTAGAVFVAPFTGTISADANDSDGTVSSVQFFLGSTSLGFALGSPFSATVSNLAAGNYSLTARAMDDRGALTTSSVVNISVITNAVVSGGAISNGQFRFNVGGISNQTYVILMSTNLTTWTPISTNVPTGGNFTFTDPQSAGQPRRYYRVQSR